MLGTIVLELEFFSQTNSDIQTGKLLTDSYSTEIPIMSLISPYLGAKIQTNQSTSYVSVGQGHYKHGILRVEREKNSVPEDRLAAVCNKSSILVTSAFFWQIIVNRLVEV